MYLGLVVSLQMFLKYFFFMTKNPSLRIKYVHSLDDNPPKIQALFKTNIRLWHDLVVFRAGICTLGSRTAGRID